MFGSCKCNNIEVRWRTLDFSVVPRACQCEYCRARGAAYVSKSGTSVEVKIRKESLHKLVEQGSKSATFHECAGCGEVVLVTAIIEGETYGALNANCMINKHGFSEPVQTHFSNQTAGQKCERWRQNWCHPVLIAGLP
jgi:hypothetical protein